jgi:hypothetical protein
MDLLKLVLTTLKKNLLLSVALVMLAIAGGIIHFYTQGISYVSNFKTNQGFVDYTLFKSLTDFNEISADVYDLPANELATSKDLLAKFRVSFVEETASSISYNLVTKDENADHKKAQDAILKLVNHNRFVQNAVDKDLKKKREELKFLKEKINQLDSLLFLPSNPYVSEIPGDAYFLYTQQLDLEEKIASTGRYEIIKPVTNVSSKDRPMLLFVILYLVLGGFIFIIFSKKPKTNS